MSVSHQSDEEHNASPSHPASVKSLKPFYLTDPFQSNSISQTTNSNIFEPLHLVNQNHGRYLNQTRSRRAPSLNWLTQSNHSSPSQSISSFHSNSISSSFNRNRRPTFDSKQSRSSSVSVLRPLGSTPNHQMSYSRSMSLSHSTNSPSPSLNSNHLHDFTDLKNSKSSPIQARSTIPYSKSNSIFIPPTHPSYLNQKSHQNNSSNLPHNFCPSPSDITTPTLDSEIDSLLASMIDCAKSFGIQDELNGIVDI